MNYTISLFYSQANHMFRFWMIIGLPDDQTKVLVLVQQNIER